MVIGQLGCVFDRNSSSIGRSIVSRGQSSFVRYNDGSLWACGYNVSGCLGLGDNSNRNRFTQVTTNINNDVKQVACGYNGYAFIVKNDGSLWSTGYNYTGQLGLGDINNRSTFTHVTNNVRQVACGEGQTFIIKTDGTVWASGYNYYGQLGLGDTTQRNSFTQVTANINYDVRQVACGGEFTFILKKDGSLWSCGRNNYGQLGVGDNTNRSTFTHVTNDVKQVACGYRHVFIIKNDNTLWACGYNNYGQLGTGTTTNINAFIHVNNDVKQVDCGMYHTFILKNDGSVWSCGYNMYGQLGLVNGDNRATFTQVINNINYDVKQIICGSLHTFVIKTDGSVYGCGTTDKGEIGFGNNTTFNPTFASNGIVI